MELLKSTLITFGYVGIILAILAGVILLVIYVPIVAGVLLGTIFLVLLVGTTHAIRMEDKARNIDKALPKR